MKVEVKVFVAIYVLLISLRSISAQEIKPELVAQNGHTSDVTAVAYSGDGQRLASAGSDGTVRVWDVSSGNVLRTMSSEPGLFFTWIAFSFDGRRILSLNEKRLVAGMTIKLWDAVTGVELKTLSGEFTSAALDPTGKMIALGEDETVKLLDAETLRPIRELNGHKATIRSIAFSPDGKTVATASDDKTVNLWNSNTGMVTLSFPEQAEAVENVAFSPDSKRLVTSTNDDKLIKLWDVATGKLIQSFAGHISDIKTLSVSTDGKTIVSLGEVGDRRIRIWDVPGGRQIGQLPVDLLCAAISPDGSTIAAGGDDTSIRFWGLRDGKELRTLHHNDQLVFSVAISPDGQKIAVGSFAHAIKLWRANSEPIILNGHTDFVTSVAFSPDGKWLASGSTDKSIRIWDVTTGGGGRKISGTRRSGSICRFYPRRKVAGERERGQDY